MTREIPVVDVRRGEEPCDSPEHRRESFAMHHRRARSESASQIASPPRSPVLIRMHSSRGITKILPSPILPSGSVRPPLIDGVDRRLDEVVVHGDLELDLLEQVHLELMSAINLGEPELSSETLNIRNGEAIDLDVRQRLLDRLELVGLDDRDDQFHDRLRLRWEESVGDLTEDGMAHVRLQAAMSPGEKSIHYQAIVGTQRPAKV